MSDKDKIILLGTEYKRVDDMPDLTFDYSALIPATESISTHTAHITDMAGVDMDATMKVQSSISAEFVIFRIQAGTVGKSYRAVVSATMTGGSRYYAEVRVEVVA